MKQWKPLIFLLLALFIPVIGYGIMHGLVYVLPVSENNTGAQLLFTILIIALGLAIPYWMLKSGVHKARLHDRREKEVKLENIPKDTKELSR